MRCAHRLLADLAQAFDHGAFHGVDRGQRLDRIPAFGQAKQLRELLQEFRLRFELAEQALQPWALQPWALQPWALQPWARSRSVPNENFWCRVLVSSTSSFRQSPELYKYGFYTPPF
jgi:hypothetical protein